MNFNSQIQAKKFFTDKIIFQAQKDGISLSDAEKYMLEWTETEEGFELKQDLIDKFNEETTDFEFEQKICNLLISAYEYDVK